MNFVDKDGTTKVYYVYISVHPWGTVHRSDVAWKRGSCPTTQSKLATNGLLFSLAYASHGTVEEMLDGNWTCPSPAPYRLGEMLFQPGC